MLCTGEYQEKQNVIMELNELSAVRSSDISVNSSMSFSSTLDEKEELGHGNVELVCENEDKAIYGFLLSELAKGMQGNDTIRLNIKEEHEFECEEIFSILQKNPKTAENSPRNGESNLFSRSAPQFTQIHSPKKISLVGKVLCGSEKTYSQNATTETSSGSVSAPQTLFKPIPIRVSNPIIKNMERFPEAVECKKIGIIGNIVNPVIHKSDNISHLK